MGEYIKKENGTTRLFVCEECDRPTMAIQRLSDGRLHLLCGCGFDDIRTGTVPVENPDGSGSFIGRFPI